MEIFGYGYMNLLELLITWRLASVKQNHVLSHFYFAQRFYLNTIVESFVKE